MTSSSMLAARGGTPIRSEGKSWPSWPFFDDREREALIEVLESGRWFNGERGARFSAEFAAFQDAKHGVVCNSGTAALEIALQAIGIQHDDEVIVPPYTFIGTASAVARVGAIPVFVDIDDTWDLNPDLLEAAITPRTKAIMPVHLGGNICDMDRINAIAEAHGLAVIEDACHSWGGKYKGKGTGALGLGGAFSFQMSKNMTAGEGGIIVTDNDDFAEVARSIPNCGRSLRGAWYEHVRVGTNARMTEWQAAILSVQLSRMEEHLEIRARNATFLNEKLAAIPGLVPQPDREGTTRRAYHLYCVRMDPDRFGCTRDQLMEAAGAEGLPVAAGYVKPLYAQPAFAEGPHGDRFKACHCPVCEDIGMRSGMWLGQTVLLAGEEDMRDIVRIFEKVHEHAQEMAQ